MKVVTMFVTVEDDASAEETAQYIERVSKYPTTSLPQREKV